MKRKSKNKQGISLIVLVITIIVMIILAAAIILSLSSNGIIDRANEAVTQQDLKQVQTVAQTIWAEVYLENLEGANLDYQTQVIKRLDAQNIDTTKYNILADKNGVTITLKAGADSMLQPPEVLEEVDLDAWEFAYSYNRTADTWTKVLKTEQESVTGDIVAKFYKIDNLITPPSITYKGNTYSVKEGNEYKLLIEGTGDMPQLMPYNEEQDLVTGGYAWQEETAMQLGGYPVTAIIPYVTEVLIGDGITSLGAFAFTGSSGLKTIVCGNDVTKILQRAFYMSGVENISFKEKITSIEEFAFYSCDKLQEININISKEEWNKMLIARSNDGLLNATINYTYRTKVERLANEGFKIAYDNGTKSESALETATINYIKSNGVSNETLALYNIVVTKNGVHVTGKETTLGDTILSALDYGKTVNYSANGINNWKVLYKQTVGTEEYVYLIASEKVDGEKIPTNIPGAIIEDDNIYWESNNAPSVVASGTINSTRWLANWSDYSTNLNGRCASYFLDEQYWTAFKNTEKYGDYVVGAIGTPTLEMFAASYNKRSIALGDTAENSTVTLTNEDNGYYANGVSYVVLSRPDSLYCCGRKVWLASPSAYRVKNLFYVYSDGHISGSGSDFDLTRNGLRPVVCLKSNIQARVGLSADNADIILK